MEIKRTADGRYAYEELPDGTARLCRCYGEENYWELPERIDGRTVTEAAPYLFSAGLASEPFPDRGACGLQIEGVSFPASLKRIGRYAFYNCHNLRELRLPGTCLDIGGGTFNGCRQIRDLHVSDRSGEKSCLKEVLSELNENVRVHYSLDGTFCGVILFPEYFEEAVENTPARILETRMHGVGHRYRYCFQNTRLSFRDYDSEALFYELRMQEKAETVMELALLRLRYPYECREEMKKEYEAYVRARMREAAAFLFRRENPGEAEEKDDLFRWLARYPAWSREEFMELLDAANRAGRPREISLLMEEKGRRYPAKRRSFEF